MPMPTLFLVAISEGRFVLRHLVPDTPEEATQRLRASMGWGSPPTSPGDDCALDEFSLGALLRRRGAVDYLLLSSSVHFPEDNGAPEGTDGLALVRAGIRLARDPSYDLKVDGCAACPYLVKKDP